MKQVRVSELKAFKAQEIADMLPFEVTCEGAVIAVMSKPGEEPDVDMKTKCPNCKFVYTVTKPDNLPSFFSVQHA